MNGAKDLWIPMTTLPDKAWYRIQEVAYHLDVGDSTIRRWIDHGKLEAAKFGGLIKISRESLDQFVKKGIIKPFE